MKYSIAPIGDQFQVKIWESAPQVGSRTKPVLYVATYKTRTWAEAAAILSLHLDKNDARLPVPAVG